jgi:uncharacterized caspase-like protein
MPEAFPHGHALLVGVGQCSYAPWSLPVTVKDVKAVREALTDPSLCGYSDDQDHVRLLHDQQATGPAILDGLRWLRDRAAADPDATAVVYYSGHGWLDPATGRYFLIAHDVIPHDIPGSAVKAEAFTGALRDVKARRLLVVIDSCHAQGMASSKEAAGPMKLPAGLAHAAATEGKGLVEGLKQGEGRAVFTSSRGRQRSWVRKDGKLSVYTHHLLEALHGAGSLPGHGDVRLSALQGHLGRAVPASARAMHHAEQDPFFDMASEDFPVALLRGGKGLPHGGWPAAEAQAQESISRIVRVVASGERAVAIGGAATGNVIITGDRNTVGQSPDAGGRG